MSSIGNITSTTQAVYSAAASRRVLPASDAAPTRSLDQDGDRSPPGPDSIWAAGKGSVVDVYA